MYLLLLLSVMIFMDHRINFFVIVVFLHRALHARLTVDFRDNLRHRHDSAIIRSSIAIPSRTLLVLFNQRCLAASLERKRERKNLLMR